MSFGPDPKARGSVKPGTVYALYRKDGLIYWAQVKSEIDVGFFRFRSEDVEDTEAALGSPIMTELTLNIPSIGSALRSGAWKKIGVRVIGEDLLKARWKAHWPEGAQFVTVNKYKDMNVIESYQTSPDDPDIQDLDVIAAWNAQYHVPNRVVADFNRDPNLNKFGCTIRALRQERL